MLKVGIEPLTRLARNDFNLTDSEKVSYPKKRHEEFFFTLFFLRR